MTPYVGDIEFSTPEKIGNGTAIGTKRKPWMAEGQGLGVENQRTASQPTVVL